jgi:hypothetical protein
MSLVCYETPIALYEEWVILRPLFQSRSTMGGEYAEAKWVDHVYDASINNDGFGGESSS